MTDDTAKAADSARTKLPAQMPPAQVPPVTAPPVTAPAPTESLAPKPAPKPQATASAARASKGLPVLLALVCVLALLGAGYLYWLSRTAATTLAARLDGLDETVAGLDQRLAAVEKRPLPPPVDLAPVDQHLAALDRRLTADEQKPPAPPPPAQLDAVGHAEIAALAGRMDQLTAREDQLGAREQADILKLGDQLAGQDTRIAGQDGKIASASQVGAKAGGEVDALTVRAAQLSTLQAASVALAAGRPLGPLPSAPPALAQFADKPPPTEASLRLSFPEAVKAAHEAGMPAPENTPFFARMWARMQSGVTIRQGGRVLVGDTASAILAQAQSQLDAGDLAGAVATLGGLSGPAAPAMAPWRAQAQSLLDARAALLTLARG